MGATHPCSSAHRHLYSNRSTGGLVRYSKGSVGDHRSRGSNQLLRGARRVRYLQGGCLLRHTGTRITEQTRPQPPPPPVLSVSLQYCASGSSWESGGPAPGHQVDTSLPPHRNRAGPPQPHARAHNADPDSPPSERAVGGGGAQDPKRPTQRSKAPPRGRPAAAPTTPSQVGGNRDQTAPPQAHQTEHGTGAGHAEGHRPRGTALPAPSAGTTRDARATPPSGSGHRESASAHTRKGHAGTTGRATGPSARNAQTAWNGVPASEGKGHPDRTARHTQGGTRGAGRVKKGRHNTRHRPEPPRTGRERRAHTDGTLHPPRQ